MHAQVNGNQQDVFRKDVHFFGPAAYGTVTTLSQLRIEERVERINCWKVGPLAALDQQIHVKVDHLKHKERYRWTRHTTGTAPSSQMMTFTTAQNI